MTVLRDGTVVDESITAHNFTKAVNVPATFKCGPRIIKNITIHHWGLPGQLHDAVVRYLASNNLRGSSAHAVISARKATSIVSPLDAAWHAGNAMGATVSIGLELRPEATDEDYVTAAAYIAMLWEEFGYLPLVKHSDWKATACPGKWDLARLERMAKAGSPAIAPAGNTEEDDMPTAAEVAKEVVEQLFNKGYARQGDGMSGVTNLGGMVAWADANGAAVPVNVWSYKNPSGEEPRDVYQIIRDTERQLLVQNELLSALAVKQGVVIDYNAIAKAILDEESKRLAE